jgi:hypothetical protein
MLPILPKPRSAVLTFAASPYLAGNNYWEEGLDLLHRSLASRFVPGDVYGDFELAQHLDVHRVLADEWILALSRTGRAKSVIKPISTAIVDPAVATGFALKPATGKPITIDIPSDLRSYDPWVDRQFDDEIDGARMPDLYVDKFFMVTVDEHYIFRRKTRKRPNGHTFVPLNCSELPRYENPAQTRRYEKCPAPDTWQAAIETLLRAGKE